LQQAVLKELNQHAVDLKQFKNGRTLPKPFALSWFVLDVPDFFLLAQEVFSSARRRLTVTVRLPAMAVLLLVPDLHLTH